jgi:hypothetical protein
MTADWYHHHLAYQMLVNTQLRQLGEQLLGSGTSVIAAARALRRFHHVVEVACPDLGNALLVFVGIDSEIDALPIGAVREIWQSLDRRIGRSKSRRSRRNVSSMCNPGRSAYPKPVPFPRGKLPKG